MRVAEERHDLGRELLAGDDFLELALDGVERELRHLEQDQPVWTQANDLPAELRPYGAAGARDQHALAADAGSGKSRFWRNRITPQEVGHVDISQLVDLGLAGNQIGQIRQGLHVHAEGLELSQDLAATPARGARQGDQDAIDAAATHQVRKRIRVINADAVDAAAL